ncbi:MAG: NAD(+) synthase, partial [Synergistaceae bacterium]|nr:NAD(+) synthase [Synergistaceae bacterium]
MSQFYRDPAHMTVFLENWIREELETSSAAGGVTGLNGETDSAVVAALLRRVCGRENMLAVIMPCRNPGEDERLSRLLAGTLDIPIKKVDLTEVYETMAGGIEASCGKLPDWAREGIKPRLRMTALYSLAHSRNFLVFGERNKDDIFCGRFTKYGEVGADALPLGDLLFGEVTALARYLGVPDEIIDRPGKG